MRLQKYFLNFFIPTTQIVKNRHTPISQVMFYTVHQGTGETLV